MRSDSAPPPSGIARKVREVTGIRTVEIGYWMVAPGEVREVVECEDIHAAIKVLRAIYNESDLMKFIQA
jgi:aspartyl aminopeptidase